MRLGSVSGSCLKASAAPDEWTGLESVMASVYMVAGTLGFDDITQGGGRE